VAGLTAETDTFAAVKAFPDLPVPRLITAEPEVWTSAAAVPANPSEAKKLTAATARSVKRADERTWLM
jgi:hypothetical protein